MKRDRSRIAGAWASVALACAPAFAVAAPSPAPERVADTAALRSPMQRDLGLSAGQLSQALQAQRSHADVGPRLRADLGDDFAGSWIERGADGRYRLIVASSSAARVDAPAGVEIRRVRHRLSALQAAKTRLDAALGTHVPGISRGLSSVHSWYVDPRSNAVVVDIARDAQSAAIDFLAASGADASLLQVRLSDAAPRTNAAIFGGMVYHLHPSWCSAGFVVAQGAWPGFLTAGHCGQPPRDTWEGAGESAWLGAFAASQFPGKDQAWVRTSIFHQHFALVTNYAGAFIPVRGSIVAPIGSPLCRSGGKTGYQCGWVTAVDVTVNYPQGAVYGLTESNACSGFGDSGGAWIDAFWQAQGIHSGNVSYSAETGNCEVPVHLRRSWFSPINPMLNDFQLQLVVAG